MTQTYDVMVIGGGAAGLSAAVVLGRSLRRVVVIDAGEPRNAPAEGAHMVLGQEGVAPLELLAKGRAEAEGYGAEIRSDWVSTIARTEEGFEAALASGDRVTARRVLLATGLTDVLPEIPGLEEQWGHSVLHCPFCHGYEVRGQRIGVLGTGPNALHHALLFGALSDRTTLFNHSIGDIDETTSARLAARGIEVVTGEVVRVESDGDRVSEVVLADGRTFAIDALAVGPTFVANAGLYEQLGGALEENPMGSFIPAGPTGETSVKGLYVAGNSADLGAGVAVSAGRGVFVGGALHGDLVMTDADDAVARRTA